MPDDAPYAPYDALLLVSFGGPEKEADVVPFLQNVTRGRNIPPERLAEVGAHYYAFGGRSPINDQCRALQAAIEADFGAAGWDLPVYWGNRNWDPYLTDTVERMRADGVRWAAYFPTSAYSSYSSCRQYRENVADARAAVGPDAPRIDQLPRYCDRPGFLDPFVDSTLAALAGLPPGSRVVFVTHSIPTAMNAASGPSGGAYVQQHQQAAEHVFGQVWNRLTDATRPEAGFDLVYCSRSGSPSQPWLEPDVNDQLADLARRDVPGVVVVPIGFVSDHMEVLYDLDTEAKDTADKLGLAFARAATPGVDPRFVALARELVLEQAGQARAWIAGEGSAGGQTVPLDAGGPGCGVGGCCAKSR